MSTGPHARTLGSLSKPPTTMKDVAALAGVSVGTVSNVLNQPEKVATATRERVQLVIGHLGFVPNRGAAALRSGRSRMIALLVPDITNPFFAEVARGAVDAADARGFMLTLCHSDGQASREQRYLDVLQELRVAGVLITPVGHPPGGLHELRGRGSGVVLLDIPARTDDFCSVSVDDVHGGLLACNHLIDGGARTIALVNGPRSLRQCSDRRRGVRDAVKRSKEDVQVIEYDLDAMSIAAGTKVVSSLLDNCRPDAIFCTNDLLAIGVQRGLTAHGVRVPEDVALMGYDDIDLVAEMPVPLTSIKQPTYELGRTAAERLLEEISAGPDHQHHRDKFTPLLVERQSTC